MKKSLWSKNPFIASLKPGALVAVAGFCIASQPAHAAIQTFFGQDLNANASVPLNPIPNSAAAETSFLSNLSGVGTETFETLSGSAPLNLVFPGAGTATLSGTGSVVTLANQTTTNGAGRYGITRDGGTESYYEAQASTGGGNFAITFSSAIAAFGFYGIDIGDFGGQLQLQLGFFGGGTQTLTVPSGASTPDGSVLYYGFISNDPSQLISSIQFLDTNTSDIFAFDNMTVGSLQQVTSAPDGGSTLALLSGSLLGLGMLRRRFLS